MDKHQLNELIDKVNQGTATTVELNAYNAFLNRAITNNPPLDIHPDEEEELKAELMERISGEIGYATPILSRQEWVSWPRVAAAASIVLALGIGTYYFTRDKPAEQRTARKETLKNDIRPGGDKAILTLANGRKISLTDAQNGKLAQQSGTRVSKTDNGTLTYTAGTFADPLTDNHDMNTIETPKGGQYQVILPDGTHVWLNAASSLKYPASFAGSKERQVQLTGEAYFEVAKDRSHPFIVNTGKQDVRVLGTHFNINSYADEPTVNTTLLEGSVQVGHNGVRKLIKPGQQAVLDQTTGNIEVQDADTELAVAWKNKQFQFESANIKTVMRMISRWYDVDVEYTGNIPGEGFGGGVSRFDNVSEVLRQLESTGKVHFRIEGRKIYVSK